VDEKVLKFQDFPKKALNFIGKQGKNGFRGKNGFCGFRGFDG
jgi:hypothetical protein